MGGTTYSKGTISVYTFPLREQGDSYRTNSRDLNINIFLPAPKCLEKYFQESARTWTQHLDDGDQLFTPCVIEKRVHSELSHHRAKLLIPPDITANSKLFVPGLVVPNMQLAEFVGRNSNPIGYVLSSEYLGSQQLYAPPDANLPLDNNIRYIGVVQDIPNDGRRRPRVILILNSKENPDVFNENFKKLEEIANSNARFWWKS